MPDDLLIGDIFRTAVRAAPGRVAAWRGDESITFAELDRRGNQVARALAALGVGYTDRVVAWNDTTLDVLPLFVALAKLGAVFAPISPLLALEEAEVMIAAAKPAVDRCRRRTRRERRGRGGADRRRRSSRSQRWEPTRTMPTSTSRGSVRPMRTSSSSRAGALGVRRVR